MNLQLTLANAAEKEATRKWREHRRDCSACSVAQRRRQPDEMCAAGRRQYGDLKDCQSELAQERRLAKLPMPGQGELFGGAELAPLADCVACGKPFEPWQRRTETDAGAGPLHGACNPELDKRERGAIGLARP